MQDTATEASRITLKERLEAEFGKPLDVIIVDAINRTGNVTAAAKDLGANRATIKHYMYIYRIYVETRARRRA